MVKMVVAGVKETKPEPIIEWSLRQSGSSVILDAKGEYLLAVLMIHPDGTIERIESADQPGIKTDDDGRIVIRNDD